MFLREAPTQTLADVAKAMNTGAEGVLVESDGFNISLDRDRIGLKTVQGEKLEVPATKESLAAIGGWVEVPTAFLRRLENDMKEYVLTELLRRSGGTALVSYTEEGIEEVRTPGERVEPSAILQIATKVLTKDAPVVEWWKDQREFRLDVIAPESRTGSRYNPEKRKVGDITALGVRLHMDLKHNLAPTASTLLYRLACTNGMERLDETNKIDARGRTPRQVLADLEAAVEEAYAGAQREVQAFYDLRNTPVDNPERALARIAREYEMPDRTLAALVERAASEDMPDRPTRFDVVNLITNQANETRIRNKTGARRRLEQIGGEIISEHAARCGHCQARLN